MQEGLKVAAVGGSSEPEQSAQVRAEVQVVSLKVTGGAARMPKALLGLIVKG